MLAKTETIRRTQLAFGAPTLACSSSKQTRRYNTERTTGWRRCSRQPFNLPLPQRTAELAQNQWSKATGLLTVMLAASRL